MADERTPLVLLVDPDRWVRDGTARFLRSAGYRTLEAGDGRSGLRLAREHRPSVILLELVLPKLSGLEMLARLPGDPRSARIPVIIVSAYARLIDRGQVAGAHQKPYGARELLRNIEWVLTSDWSSTYRAADALTSSFRHEPPGSAEDARRLLDDVDQFLRDARGGAS